VPLAAPSVRTILLAVLAGGCGNDRPLGPRPSMILELESTGLPDGSAAEYRIFIQDTVAIAHGEVASRETDTVRVGSSDPVTVRWLDTRVPIAEVEYVFGPAEPQTIVEAPDGDTTVALLASYALASGGFVLTTPGIPAEATASWRAWSGDSVTASGPLSSSVAVRRGDLRAAFARLQLDTAYIERDGVPYGYAPPQSNIPLIVPASLELIAVDAPYALATSAARLSPSGLPPGTVAICRITAVSGRHGVIGWTLTGTVQTVGLIQPGSYVVTWDEATVDGVTYRPDPASIPATLEPRIEPYEFGVVYTAEP
jgi:hypothetical protein